MNDCCCSNATYRALQLSERNPGIAVKDFVDILETYWADRKNFTYDQGKTPFSAGWNGGKFIDCSSLVLLGLYGLPLSDSPYAGYNLQANNYPWAFPYAESLNVRTAADICKCLTAAGKRVKLPTEDPATYTEDGVRALGVDKGDIIFYAFKHSDGSWVRPDRYLKISHVAVVRGWFEDRPIIESSTPVSTVTVPIRHSSWQYSNSSIVAICKAPFQPDDYGRLQELTVAQSGGGTGTVTGVNNKYPDAEGMVHLTAPDVGASTEVRVQIMIDTALGNVNTALDELEMII